MDKYELIEAVRELNATASIEFLSQFSHEELEAYLGRLLQTNSEELSLATAGYAGAF